MNREGRGDDDDVLQVVNVIGWKQRIFVDSMIKKRSNFNGCSCELLIISLLNDLYGNTP